MNPLAADGPPPHLFGSTARKPTVVFVPGAFHTAAHFGPLSRYLETQGCESFAVRLPSIGEKDVPGAGGMVEDVAAIRSVLKELVWDEEGGDGKDCDDDDNEEQEGNDNHNYEGKSGKKGAKNSQKPSSKHDQSIKRDTGKKNIILVMHSTGAVAGCQAISKLERSFRIKKGKEGGIISLFFIGGFLLDEGESLESTMLSMGEKAMPGYAEAGVSCSRLRTIFSSSLVIEANTRVTPGCHSSDLQCRGGILSRSPSRQSCILGSETRAAVRKLIHDGSKDDVLESGHTNHVRRLHERPRTWRRECYG